MKTNKTIKLMYMFDIIHFYEWVAGSQEFMSKFKAKNFP